MVKKVSTEQEEKKETKEFTYAVGKRKSSRARVRVYDVKELPVGEETFKKGDIIVNGKKIGDYFSGKVAEAYYSEPLKIVNAQNRYIFTIRTSGGGKNGQLKAVVHGISRVLAKLDRENNRTLLKRAGLLTRDARIRERRKVGMGGKARRKKQSPKR